SLLVTKADNPKSEGTEGIILYRDLDQAKAVDRRNALITSLADKNINAAYVELNTPVEIGLPFKRTSVGQNYLSWALLTDLFPVSFAGVKTSRDDVVVDIDRERLIKRMNDFFDANVSHEEM